MVRLIGYLNNERAYLFFQVVEELLSLLGVVHLQLVVVVLKLPRLLRRKRFARI